MPTATAPNNKVLERDRRQLLTRLQHGLEPWMVALSFVWIVLLVVDLTRGLTPLLQKASDAIWIAFVVQFAVEFVLAPHKRTYFTRNWLTAVSLLLPALRVFRIARVVRLLRVTRAVRGLRLVRLIGSLNRGMGALGKTLGRRGFPYVAGLTAVVVATGAAGMLAFERGVADDRLDTYGDALWWTAMLISTLGSDYWPQSPEGRILCLALSFYALAVLGYITAALASFFVERDADSTEAQLASERSVELLRREIASLRAELALAQKNGGTAP